MRQHGTDLITQNLPRQGSNLRLLSGSIRLSYADICFNPVLVATSGPGGDLPERPAGMSQG